MKTLWLTILTLVLLGTAHGQQPLGVTHGPTSDEVAAADCRVTFYDDNSSPALWHPTALAQDAQGMIWISSWNGLTRYDGVRFENFKIQAGQDIDVPNDRIRNILPDADGTLLCIVEEQSVCRFDPRSCRYSAVSADEAQRALSRHAAMRHDSGALPHDTLCGHNWLRGIHHEMVDSQHNRWYIAPTGIYKVTPLAPACQRVAAVSADVVRCTYRDRQGHIWVCTKHEGRGEVALFDADMTLKGYLGRDGRLHAQHTPFYDIFCMQHTATGMLWLGSKPDGLFRLDATALLADGHAPVARFFAGESFYDIQEDAAGHLWLAVFGQGIFRLSDADSDSPALCDAVSEALPVEARKVRRLLVADGRVMAATTEGFVVLTLGRQDDPQEVVAICHHQREPRRANSLDCSAITSLALCDGRVVTTSESGGLNHCDAAAVGDAAASFTHLTTRQGLGSDIAFSVLPLPDGTLVVQSNNMLTLLRGLDDRQPVLLNHNYFGTALRLSDAAPLLLADGRLLLALEDGVALLRLDALRQGSHNPHIALTAVTGLDGVDLWHALTDSDTAAVLRLDASQRNAVVRYAALDYRADGALLYATSFVPKGDKVVYGAPTTAHETQLYDLAPGTYTLSIRSTNALGLWCDNDRQLTVVVEPRFHETLLARVLFLLLIAAIAVAITYTYLYIRALERQRHETLEKYLALLGQQRLTDVAAEDAAPTPEPSAPVQAAATPQPSQPASLLSPSSPSPADDAFMQRLMAYVEDNLSNCDASVDDMASATATSRSSLNRKMRHLVGVSPADFLKEARLKRADLLLRTTDVPLADVAFQCGFASSKYFAKCFKESMGITPREVRDQAAAQC